MFKYNDKVRVKSGFYKKQKGIVKMMNDGFLGTLYGMDFYSDKQFKIELEDRFITDWINESDLELIK